MGRPACGTSFAASPDLRLTRPVPLLLDELLVVDGDGPRAVDCRTVWLADGTLASDAATGACCLRQSSRNKANLRQEIPVHRTFVEFGDLSPSGFCQQRAMRTAPAALGHSICADLASPGSPAPVAKSTPRSEDYACGADGSFTSDEFHGNEHCPNLPAVTYCFSPASARAAGIEKRRNGLWFTSRRSLACSASHDVLQKERVFQGWRAFRREVRHEVRRKERCLSAWRILCDTSRQLVENKPSWQPHASCGPIDQSVDDADKKLLEDEDGSSDVGDEHCPVYAEGAELPSVGSALHSVGACKRCCFFPKGRCMNGSECQFCHFAHEKRKSQTKGKKKNRRRKPCRSTCAGEQHQLTHMPVVDAWAHEVLVPERTQFGSIVVHELMPAQSMAAHYGF